MTSYENRGFNVEGAGGTVLSTINLDKDPSPHRTAASNPTSGKSDKKAPKKYKPSCCTVFFLVLASVGIVMDVSMLAGGYQAMFDSIMRSQLVLKEGSKTFEMWESTPFPLYLQLYFFNVTNPEEWMRGGKIKVEEVGPIVYEEFHQKFNISWFDENATVSYMQERWWTFNDEMSVVKEDAIICTLNTIPISAVYSVRHSWMMLEGLNQNIKNTGEELFMYVPAGDLLFHGFTTPLLNFTHDIIEGNIDPPDLSNVTIPDLIVNWIDNHNISLPTADDIAGLLPAGLVDYDKFGWFYGRNHSKTYDGHWNTYTGQDDISKLGDIGWQNYVNVTEFFPAPCNEMRGSGGEMFSPNKDKTWFEFWSPDLCITVKMHFTEEVVDENGLELYRYVADNRTFSNGSTWPENECLCVHGTCAPMGTINAESCRYGSPSLISLPHYYMADPWAANNVEGIHEATPDDSFYFDLIPEMGVPAHVSVKMQINMRANSYPGETYCLKSIGQLPVSLDKGPCPEKKAGDIYTYEEYNLGKVDMFENITDGYIPLLWFKETADLPDEYVGQMKMLTYIMRTPVMTIFFSVSLAISIAILIGCSFRVRNGKKKARNAQIEALGFYY